MSSADLSEVPPRLRRDVGLLPLFMVSAGSVIGSGWLLGTLNASEVAGPAALISWIIGVILLIGIALIYAELGSTYPISGSTARFTWIHAGTLGGFFCGTYSYLQAMAVAPIEVEATLGYLAAKYWPWLENSKGLLTGRGLLVAIAFMFAFTALNLFGIKWMARTNTIAMYWKILVPILTIILIMSKVFHGSNFHAAGGFMPFGIKGVFIAIPLGIVFALEGFEQAAQLAGEARNPKRDVPIAVVGSMLMGAAIYILLQLCFTGALNPATLAHSGWANPFGTAGKFGPFTKQLFVGDQTHSTVMRVFLEKVNGRYQGACFPFRKGFGSGNVPVRFAADGSLIVGGTNRGWGSTGPHPFALERLAWTGKTPFEIHEMRARPDGFELTFTRPVDKAAAAESQLEGTPGADDAVLAVRVGAAADGRARIGCEAGVGAAGRAGAGGVLEEARHGRLDGGGVQRRADRPGSQ